MDFSKAIDIVPRVILIKKLDHYGVKGRNLWFKSYLTDDNSNTSFANILCGDTSRIYTGPFNFSLDPLRLQS